VSFDFSKAIVAHVGNAPARRAIALGVAVASAMAAFAPTGAALASSAPAGQPAATAYESGFVRGAALAQRPSTCFGRQLDAVAQGGRVGLATVWLKQEIRMADGSLDAIAGSGTVVADSAGPEGHNRIVTASHVVDASDLPDGAVLTHPGEVQVLSSDGHVLGRARLAALSQPPSPSLANDRAAVLAITGGDMDRYDAIRGLDLARRLPDRTTTSLVGTPFALSQGASGGGSLDRDGNLVGVVWGVSTAGASTLRVVGINAQNIDDLSGARARGAAALVDYASALPVAMQNPAHDRAYFHPLTDPAVLGALGTAGRDRVAVTPSREGMRFTLAGYPSSTCVVYSGTAVAFDKGDPLQKVGVAASEMAAERFARAPIENEVRRKADGSLLVYGEGGKLAAIVGTDGVTREVGRRDAPAAADAAQVAVPGRP
jgi:hypothetical protein